MPLHPMRWRARSQRPDGHNAKENGTRLGGEQGGPRPGGGTHRVAWGNNETFTSSLAGSSAACTGLSPAFCAPLTEQALAETQVGES